MAKADTSVKWFHSAMVDAPALISAAGALINLLDTCLLDGFSTRTPDGVVVSDGVATVSIGAGNPYEKHAVITIGGASAAALNAEWRIDSSSASSFTFLCPGVADGTVTGASVKRAPAGWAKPFSGTNLAAYQSLDANGTQLYLRVDDSLSNTANVRGYENLTDINTGVGLFPTQGQITTLRWPRNGGRWTIIADGSFMWVLLKATNEPLLNYFGDIVTFKANDKYHCLLAAVNGSSYTGTGHSGSGYGSGTATPRVIARGASQAGGATFAPMTFLSSASNSWCGLGGAIASNSYDGNIRLGASVFVVDGTAGGSDLRGILPGVVSTLESPGFADLSVIEVGGSAYLAVSCNAAFNSVGSSISLFDIKGPWR